MNRPDSRGTLQGIPSPATLPVTLAVGADDALTPLARLRIGNQDWGGESVDAFAH